MIDSLLATRYLAKREKKAVCFFYIPHTQQVSGMNCVHTIAGSPTVKLALCLGALVTTFPASATVRVEDVNIFTIASIVGEPGAPSALTVDAADSGGSLGAAAVGSIARYDVPPLRISPGVVQTFPPIVGRATQTINGLNRVAIDAPMDLLGGKVHEIRAQADWSVAVRNDGFDPVLLDFTIFGGELTFDCYNCLNEITTIELSAEIHRGFTSLWNYRAALTTNTTNRFLPPSFSLAGSSDPQGLGFPMVTITDDAAQSQYKVDIHPFSGHVEFLLPQSDVDTIGYHMSARVTGDISNEGLGMHASLGDPFAFSGGSSGPTFLLNGQTIEALLVPVPEPHEYALMLVGLGLVGLAARRRH